MIPRLTGLLVRALLETAVVLLTVALLLGVVSWRIGRRAWTEQPDRFEQQAGGLERLARLALPLLQQLARQRSGSGVPAAGAVDSEL